VDCDDNDTSNMAPPRSGLEASSPPPPTVAGSGESPPEHGASALPRLVPVAESRVEAGRLERGIERGRAPLRAQRLPARLVCLYRCFFTSLGVLPWILSNTSRTMARPRPGPSAALVHQW